MQQSRMFEAESCESIEVSEPIGVTLVARGAAGRRRRRALGLIRTRIEAEEEAEVGTEGTVHVYVSQ